MVSPPLVAGCEPGGVCMVEVGVLRVGRTWSFVSALRVVVFFSTHRVTPAAPVPFPLLVARNRWVA